jgi:hypothetical protein
MALLVEAYSPGSSTTRTTSSEATTTCSRQAAALAALSARPSIARRPWLKAVR